MPPPHEFVRWLTVALALSFAIRAGVNLCLAVVRLGSLAHGHGIPRTTVLRAAGLIGLRATLLEPLNLALTLLLVALAVEAWFPGVGLPGILTAPG